MVLQLLNELREEDLAVRDEVFSHDSFHMGEVDIADSRAFVSVRWVMDMWSVRVERVHEQAVGVDAQ